MSIKVGSRVRVLDVKRSAFPESNMTFEGMYLILGLEGTVVKFKGKANEFAGIEFEKKFTYGHDLGGALPAWTNKGYYLPIIALEEINPIDLSEEL